MIYEDVRARFLATATKEELITAINHSIRAIVLMANDESFTSRVHFDCIEQYSAALKLRFDEATS